MCSGFYVNLVGTLYGINMVSCMVGIKISFGKIMITWNWWHGTLFIRQLSYTRRPYHLILSLRFIQKITSIVHGIGHLMDSLPARMMITFFVSLEFVPLGIIVVGIAILAYFIMLEITTRYTTKDKTIFGPKSFIDQLKVFARSFS